MNPLMSVFNEEDHPRIPVTASPIRQLSPSNELCLAMASAQHHAGSGYLCTRDILHGLASTGDRRVAESAKRLLRDLPLMSDLRETNPGPRLREFLYEIDRSRERQVDRE